MSSESLQDVIEATDSIARHFRSTDFRSEAFQWEFPDKPFSYPYEFSHWIEEQRAWNESAILMDQSYHIATLFVQGPEALEFFSDMGTNSLASFEENDPPLAKQQPLCSPEGYMIGDTILFNLNDDLFAAVGGATIPQKWLEYNLETGDYDASVLGLYTPYHQGTPIHFRFEIQGPNTIPVLEEIADGPLPDIGFFEMGEITIGGKTLYALGHGMAGSPGLEIFGPYAYHDEIEERILSVAEEYRIRQLGYRAYFTTVLGSGWLAIPPPAIYTGEELRGYREWLRADGLEATLSFGGSFESDDISDYYIDPVDIGYDHIIKLDHDFVGRDAIEDRLGSPARQKVTFEWDPDDVLEIFGSLFREGETYQFIEFPGGNRFKTDAIHFDEVRAEGELVGLSMLPGYDYNFRKMLSVGLVDTQLSDPGTEVTILWGESEANRKNIERHVQKEISATVAPAPYTRAREDL